LPSIFAIIEKFCQVFFVNFFLKSLMVPVRCYTCNKVLGHLEIPMEEYLKTKLEMSEAVDPKVVHRKIKTVCWMEFFEKYTIRRYCCKRVLMTSVVDMNMPCDLDANRKLPDTVERLPREDNVINIINGV